MAGIMGKVNVLLEWMIKLTYINILWGIFTIVGVGIFGIVPATVSLFAVMRQWLKGNEPKTFEVFKTYYIKEFFKSNKLGFCLTVLGFILYFDLSFFRSMNHIIFLILTYFTFLLIVLYLSLLLIIFPLYVHQNLKISQYLKNGFYIVMSNPMVPVLIFAGVLGINALIFFVPGLIPFFAISAPALFIMWFANKLFIKLHQ
ncbi:YesL family protein [Pseudalkalibacillus salsuginis]|uniref:YesL family protein n=1 Tax=Pseudalkalibacillus salsuginis TaxID=2910972 RepID=UPI001F28AF40|nr:DUF624 domain-containing protein [Pseudalkalibacillus salsuginis]MCF6409982.1 DUF624 domain-containing protein [Pseudalkalibacillus salsuginis]